MLPRKLIHGELVQLKCTKLKTQGYPSYARGTLMHYSCRPAATLSHVNKMSPIA